MPPWWSSKTCTNLINREKKKKRTALPPHESANGTKCSPSQVSVPCCLRWLLLLGLPKAHLARDNMLYDIEDCALNFSRFAITPLIIKIWTPLCRYWSSRSKYQRQRKKSNGSHKALKLFQPIVQVLHPRRTPWLNHFLGNLRWMDTMMFFTVRQDSVTLMPWIGTISIYSWWELSICRYWQSNVNGVSSFSTI